MRRVFNKFVYLVAGCIGILSLSACDEKRQVLQLPIELSAQEKPSLDNVKLSISSSNISFSVDGDRVSVGSEVLEVAWNDNWIDSIELEKSEGGIWPEWLGVEKLQGGNPTVFHLTASLKHLTFGRHNANLNLVAKTYKGDVVITKPLTVDIDVPQTQEPLGRGPTDKITHFGQEIVLNGANIPWSADSGGWFNNDIGDIDATGQPRTNIPAFRNHFRRIGEAGGNSARIWLHTAGTTTPVIDQDGSVSGLSRYLSNAEVVGQLDAILDVAWEEGVLVTFSLFSFDMICERYSSLAAKRMLEENYQTYIDNALIPMVEGLRFHPGLLAWEVFNEPEGMTETDYFCPSNQTVSTEAAQRVINQTAAAIHTVDPHVKVTTSTHTDLFDRFSNASLLSLPDADPTGTLDFYQLHWYDTGWQVSPFIIPASDFNADRPIIIGEFGVEPTDNPEVQPQNTIRLLLQNGYHGAWPWSLTTGNATMIEAAIVEASSYSGDLNKAEIEACIERGVTACAYN